MKRIVREVKKLAKNEGLVVTEVATTGRTHYRFTLEDGGRFTTIVTSRSPSDGRAFKNIRGDMRRFKRSGGGYE